MVDGKTTVPAPIGGPSSPFPQRVGRYELLLPLGTGGMATVFLARAHGAFGFERHVALKLLHAHLREDAEAKLHLLEEAKLAARIRHPNVVPVIEIDDDPVGLYLVMEYVEGETLSALLQAARAAKVAIPSPIAARILDDALAGLEAAHALRSETGTPLDLVHRDFSPQNILVATDGRTRLTDFGIAKAAGRAVRTKTGLVKGKVAYMSPEQARGHEVDRRCDVWAAGVLAWELVAGRRLHDSRDDVATLLSVVTEEPPLLSIVVDDVSPEVEATVASALTSDLDRRCGSAAELRARLQAAWERGAGVASHEAVGEFVLRLVGPRVVERRAQAAKIRVLRAGTVAAAPDDPVTDITMTAPNSGRRPNDAETAYIGVAKKDARVGSAPVPVTSDSASSIVAQIEERRSTRRTVASGLIAAAAIAAMITLAVASTTAPHADPASNVDTAPASSLTGSTTPPTPVTTAPAEPVPNLEGDLQPVEVAARASASRMVVRHVHAATHPAERSEAPKRAAPRSSAPKKLAGDPYGGN
jgi:serine/threonine-protein kinase